MSVTTEIRSIGPAEAKDLLAKNTKNRAILPANVAKLVAEMSGGTWYDDGSPIRIAEDGRLLDGQHRLAAVIQSETTHHFIVVEGLTAEAQGVMDTGRKRTFADALSMNGEVNASKMAGFVLAVYRWEVAKLRGARLFNPGGNTTRETLLINPNIPTLLAFFEAHSDFRDEFKAARYASGPAKLPISVIGLAYHVLIQIDYDDATYFFERLRDGAGLEAGNPILAFRNRMIEMSGEATANGNRVRPDVILALLFKSWNAYRDGRTIQRLYFKPGGANPEAWPEPR